MAVASDEAGGKVGEHLREWSTFIGIAIAIGGNILISFALNIQRYAHLRLERDQKEQGMRKHALLSKDRVQRKYGTQEDIADERARLNEAATHKIDDQNGDEDVAREYVHAHRATSLSTESQSSRSSPKLSEKREPSPTRKTYLKSPYWWGGIILMTTGEAGNFLAYGFAPASIVSPLGVVALISNCVIAPCLLKERFRQRDFWGVLIAVAGTVTIVLSAKTSTGKMGPDDLWEGITRWEFETYLGITAAFIVALMWASGKYGQKSILIDLGLVSLFGGYTALSTKGVASLLSDTLWRALTYPVTYLLLAVLILTALMQIRYVNRALQHFDSTQVIPVQFVLFTLSVIIGSAILYRDFESTTVDRIGKFVGGCLMTFLGVYLITSKRSRESSSDDLNADDEENVIGLVDDEETEETPLKQSERLKVKSTGSDGNASVPRLSSYESSSSPAGRLTGPSSPSKGLDPHMASHSWQESQENIHKSPRRDALDSNSSSPTLTPIRLPSSEQIPRKDLRRPGSEPRDSLSRRSMARLTPGEYTSPLSSSLSAIIAEQKRRGSKSSKPHTSRLAGSSEVWEGEGHRQSEDNTNENTALMGDPGSSQPPDRSRRVSDSLISLLSSKKKERKGKSTESLER